jgi:hypothetical protein
MNEKETATDLMITYLRIVGNVQKAKKAAIYAAELVQDQYNIEYDTLNHIFWKEVVDDLKKL